MGIIEDIQRMRKEGRADQDISSALGSQGYSPQEVTEALAQAKIKDAVSGGEHTSESESSPGEFTQPKGMQPSMLSPQTPPAPEQSEQQYVGTPQQQSSYGTAEYDQYAQQQQSYSSGVSADTISEIAEQVVSEKL